MAGREPWRVLVTGASYGLGAAVADAVRARGDHVVSASRTAPASGTDHWLATDFADLASISARVSSLIALAGGPFDGVVLNAAVADKSRSQWTVEQAERHIRINALAPLALWTALNEQGSIADQCNVVLIGSYLQNGNARQPAYAMSKAALWSWMRSYTLHQSDESGISMNMIWPGRVATPANPPRELPSGDPNHFYAPERVAEVVLRYLYQAPGGPRGTVVDMGRS